MNIKGFTLGVAIVVVLFTCTVRQLATRLCVRALFVYRSFPSLSPFLFSFFSLQIKSSTLDLHGLLYVTVTIRLASLDCKMVQP